MAHWWGTVHSGFPDSAGGNNIWRFASFTIRLPDSSAGQKDRQPQLFAGATGQPSEGLFALSKRPESEQFPTQHVLYVLCVEGFDDRTDELRLDSD